MKYLILLIFILLDIESLFKYLIKNARSWIIILINVFKLAIKISTSKFCTIIKVARFFSQNIHILIKLIVIIKRAWKLKISLITNGMRRRINFLQNPQISSMLLSQSVKSIVFIIQSLSFISIWKDHAHHHFSQLSQIYWKIKKRQLIMTLLKFSWEAKQRESHA